MELIKFLIKAKINTYASSGEGGEQILNDGYKELVYNESDFKYQDRYYGFNPFIGQEIAWQSNKKIWGMNYYGGAVSDKIPAKEVYQFL